MVPGVAVVAFSVTLLPKQAGPVLVAVASGGDCSTTSVVAGAEAHPFTVIITLYVPVSAAVNPFIAGLAMVEVKPLGPVHA